jgi:GT2 family glycosyltransferase
VTTPGLASGAPPVVPLAGGAGPPSTVSVVCLNYNGRRYLERFLRSALAIDYPTNRYEVVLIDNASTDDSVTLVRSQFPRVRVVESAVNLGFAGGCNLGMRATRGEYVALVNNDTVVEPDWLRALVEVAESDPRIGSVGSKILFLTPYLDLGLDVLDAGTAGAGPAVMLLHEARAAGCEYDKLVLRAGNLARSHDAHVLGRSARLAVPVADTSAPATILLRLRAAPGRRAVAVAVLAGDTLVRRLELTPTPSTFRVEIPRHLAARAVHDVINNAGTHIDAAGRFADRGIFEFDHGQYDHVEEVFGLCGASMLLRRAMLDQVGGFDTRYFMYFEDLDLSWRARRAGWRLVYTPASRLRHVHAGSSTEWSPQWTFFVTRNHLFWLVKNGTAPAARQALRAFYGRALRALAARVVGSPRSLDDTRATIDLQVARSLARHLPGLLVSRYQPPEVGGRNRWTAVGGERPLSA